MKTISIRHNRLLPSKKTIDRLTCLIVLVPGNIKENSWESVPYGSRIHGQLKNRKAACNAGDIETLDLPNVFATHVVVVFVSKNYDTFQRLTLARKTIKVALRCLPSTLSILFHCGERDGAPWGEALSSALYARLADLPSYKSKEAKPIALRTVHYYGLTSRVDTRRVQAEAAGNELARRLTQLPANKLTPALYRKEIGVLAKQHGWRTRFYDINQLKRKRAGAFLAVVQGSATKDAGIMHLSYRPPRAKGKPVALVGKGICFDTGGVNVKTARYMQHMQEDMAGSAVALGALLTFTQLQVTFPIDCWLALAQNHVGPDAYKPGDVVTALNGTTIEVVHTDAEGRMVLADTLALAARNKPRLIIDYATLTGACVYALSTRYSGVLTNREAYLSPLIEVGRISGERIWPFPIDEDFDEALESDIADLKQCALDGEADHIIAARFLKRFVEDTPWVHIDLAAGRHRGGLAHIPTDTTGFGVRFTLELLLGRYLEQSK